MLLILFSSMHLLSWKELKLSIYLSVSNERLPVCVKIAGCLWYLCEGHKEECVESEMVGGT